VTYTTTLAGARATVLALRASSQHQTINCLQTLHATFTPPSAALNGVYVDK